MNYHGYIYIKGIESKLFLKESQHTRVNPGSLHPIPQQKSNQREKIGVELRMSRTVALFWRKSKWKATFQKKVSLSFCWWEKTLLFKTPWDFGLLFPPRGLCWRAQFVRGGEKFVFRGSNGHGIAFLGHWREAGGFWRCSSMLPHASRLVTLQIFSDLHQIFTKKQKNH